MQSTSDCKVEDDGMSTLQVRSQQDVCTTISGLITSGEVVYLGPENWTDAVYNCGFKSVIYLNGAPAGMFSPGVANFMAVAQQTCSDKEFYGVVMCRSISDPKFCESGANEGVPVPGLYPGKMRNQMWTGNWIMSVSNDPLTTGNVKQVCTYNSIDGVLSTDEFAEFANDVFAECSGAGLPKETTEASSWCYTKSCDEVVQLCTRGHKCCDYAKGCALHPNPSPSPSPSPSPTPGSLVILGKLNFTDYVDDGRDPWSKSPWKDADVFVDFYSAE